MTHHNEGPDMKFRVNLRFPVRLPAELTGPSSRLRGETIDLSFQGTRLQISTPVPALDDLTEFHVRLASAQAAVTLMARLAYRDDQNLGLSFMPYGDQEGLYLSQRLAEVLVPVAIGPLGGHMPDMAG